MQIRPILNLHDLPSQPWKNGGGSTRTLAVHPPKASLEDFLWRISLAEVASSGPFSTFPGIDRTIALWRGPGMLLESPERAPHHLTNLLNPYDFPGEIPIRATLLDGPTTDLNLMIRRDAVTATLQRCDSPTPLPPADDLILICHTGAFEIDLGDSHTCTLTAQHFLHASNLPHSTRLAPIDPASTILCATIHVVNRP